MAEHRIRVRSTAGARREEILAAALQAFAQTGYRGTAVGPIAAAAGISEGYAFRLFGDKRGLFIATLHKCFAEIIQTLTRSVESPENAERESPAAILDAMAIAYARLISRRELLMIQVQAVAASDDPAIRDALLAEQRDLVTFVRLRSGAPDPAIQEFFARGQLCHFVTALGLVDSNPSAVSEPWADILTRGIRHF